MGVEVVDEEWVSLRKRPPKEAMVALVVKAMVTVGVFSTTATTTMGRR